ncbi:MAG: pyridoxamine 5'-phosphate oxidase family protein [Deltaproteobacteria bacterium]|nr:pyridoxamine 5'-phosphate oxidase family protein [Deltaproteobacteria bacterium]
MDLNKYFKEVKGTGVLATADNQGRVDVAVYARPHVMDPETVAFIMPDRLTHHNLQSNNHAAYLFMEQGAGYKGVRLLLTKMREETEGDLIKAIRQGKYGAECGEEEHCFFLVYFKVDKVLPLIGAEKKL